LAFRERLVARGLCGGTVHGPMGRMVLGAPDEPWRREAVGVQATYLRFASGIAASGVVMHPVPNPKFVEDGTSAASLRRIGEAVLRSLDDLVPVAEEAGVRILLENLPYHCEFPLQTMKELRPLVDGYPAEAVGLVVDTGHAWTSGENPCDEIRAAGPRLWGTHLQDVDYENPTDNHWVPTEGDLDWEAIPAALREVRYEGAWTFEAEKGRHDETREQLARMCRDVAEAWGLRPAPRGEGST
jgi:sugar phosphate isomerase/epimerase